MKKNMKGITLVSLVITIIVMLILAGVSIAAATNNNGAATKGKEASVKTNLGSLEEEINLAISDVNMSYETIWAENSSIAAFKGVFFTYEKLNDALDTIQVIPHTNTEITPNFVTTQDDWLGTGTSKKTVPANLTDYVSAKEHPLCQLAYINDKTNTATNLKSTLAAKSGILNTIKNPRVTDGKSRFVMYFSDIKKDEAAKADLRKVTTAAEVKVGSSVYAGIFTITDGVPKLVDLGIVQCALSTADIANGYVGNESKDFPAITAYGKSQIPGTSGPSAVSPTAGVDNGLTDVIWLKGAYGLQDLPIKE